MQFALWRPLTKGVPYAPPTTQTVTGDSENIPQGVVRQQTILRHREETMKIRFLLALVGLDWGPIPATGYWSVIREGDDWKIRMLAFNVTPAPAK